MSLSELDPNKEYMDNFFLIPKFVLYKGISSKILQLLLMKKHLKRNKTKNILTKHNLNQMYIDQNFTNIVYQQMYEH